MIKELIQKWFKAKETIKLTKIYGNKVSNALPRKSNSTEKDGVIMLSDDSNHFILDPDYKSCSLTEFKEMLKKDFTNWKIWNKNYDCDNFAFKLCSNLKTKYPMLSVGIVISTGHAYNVFVDKFGKAHYIEPQTDKIYSYSKLTKLFKPIILIII